MTCGFRINVSLKVGALGRFMRYIMRDNEMLNNIADSQLFHVSSMLRFPFSKPQLLTLAQVFARRTFRPVGIITKEHLRDELRVMAKVCGGSQKYVVQVLGFGELS